MVMDKVKKKSIAVAVVAAFGLSSVPVIPLSAATIDNRSVVAEQSIADDRVFVKDFMARDDVQEQFVALGVDPKEAELRVAALSDEEVAKLASDIKSSPAGQGAVGAVIGAALVIFLVLLITDLLGFTKVFDFTEKGSANPS